jgi:SHS2 domain-containing protein
VDTREADARSGFRALEHTADRAIEAWGPALPDLFRAATEGMFSESTNSARVKAEQEWSIQVEAASLDDLLQAWLSELLWVSERDDAAICRVEVDSVNDDPWRALGRAWGGAAPRGTPHTGAPVKAVTYHNLRVWHEGDLWRAHLVFDV